MSIGWFDLFAYWELLTVVTGHKGEVQKDLHNNDLEFIKYKYFYNDDEECK